MDGEGVQLRGPWVDKTSVIGGFSEEKRGPSGERIRRLRSGDPTCTGRKSVRCKFVVIWAASYPTLSPKKATRMGHPQVQWLAEMVVWATREIVPDIPGTGSSLSVRRGGTTFSPGRKPWNANPKHLSKAVRSTAIPPYCNSTHTVKQSAWASSLCGNYRLLYASFCREAQLVGGIKRIRKKGELHLLQQVERLISMSLLSIKRRTRGWRKPTAISFSLSCSRLSTSDQAKQNAWRVA